jgi:hypothetical protein
MADAAILKPDLVRTPGNMFIQKPAVYDSTNTFAARSLVKLVAGVTPSVIACASDEVLVYGITPDNSKTATQIPPDSMFGENHYVFDIAGGEIEINVGHLSGTALVQGAANSAKTPADVAIGTAYGIAVPTTGVYAGIEVLDPTETTATLFTVVGRIDNVAQTDANGRVRVRPIAAKIQP